MRFGVRPNCRRGGASRIGCINDADDARQKCLSEGADENPTAKGSRESSSWCHLTWVRELTAFQCNLDLGSGKPAQPSAHSFVFARVARALEKTFVSE
jgi:hypothetical protein